MALINQALIDATQVSFDTTFNSFLGKLNTPDAFWNQLAMVMNTNTPEVQHKWLGDVPGFTEWVGDRKLGQVGAHSYTIVDKSWSSGLEVDQRDLEDDRLGLYAPKIRMLAEKAMNHRLNLLIDFLVKGFATTTYGAGYDGEAFFSASHASGSNKATASLDDSGALNTGLQKLLQQVGDEDGEPLGIVGTHLVVGPKLRAEAFTQVKAQQLASGASNINFNVVDVIVSPKLVGDYDDYWFLVDLSKPVKPLILQMRKEVGFDEMDNARSEKRFMKNKLYFGASARYNVGYGMHQLAYGSDGTA